MVKLRGRTKKKRAYGGQSYMKVMRTH